MPSDHKNKNDKSSDQSSENTDHDDTTSTSATESSDDSRDIKADRKKELLRDLKNASKELEKAIQKNNKLDDSSSHSDETEVEQLVASLHDLKSDMSKVLKIIGNLDKMTVENKNEAENIKKEVEKMKKNFNGSEVTSFADVEENKKGKDNKDCKKDDKKDNKKDDVSLDTISEVSEDFENMKGKQKFNDNSSVYSQVTLETCDSNNSLNSSVTKNTSATSETVCSYDEFEKFKHDVLHMLEDLSKRVNDQMGILANIMMSSYPSARKNH